MAATVLRPYCDRFLDQLALRLIPVALLTQCGRGRSHKSLYGRTSRFSRSAEFWNVQNSLLPLLGLSALAAVAVRSDLPTTWLSTPWSHCFNCARSVRSHDCTCTATTQSQVVRMNCNFVTHNQEINSQQINRDYRVSDRNHLDLCESHELCTTCHL